jgi:hypothetical protein
MEIPHNDYISQNKTLEQIDLDYCDEHLEAIADLFFGKLAALPSGFDKSNIVNYIPGVDAQSDEMIYDLAADTSYEIQNYTEAARLTNQPFGVQTLSLESDSSGRPTGVVPDNTADFLNSSDAYVDTGFRPNLGVMTLIESVEGLLEDLDVDGISLGTTSQRLEMRVLKTDGVYKINDVLQGYSPAMPDTGSLVELDDVAVLGYPDVVDRTTCIFKVITEITDDAEDTAEFDAWVACNPALVTVDGIVLTTDDGIPLTRD